MNKMKKWTYLYKEMDKCEANLGLKELIIVYNEKYNYINKKNILYMFDPTLEDNIKLYNRLFKNKWDYIFPSNFEKIQINKKEYMSVLNISNKASVYALFNRYIEKQKINYIINYVAIILADEIVLNKVTNIKNGLKIIDIALDIGKDIYAIPGEINNTKSYLANYMIKQGCSPLCDIYDVRYLLLQKHYKRC